MTQEEIIEQGFKNLLDAQINTKKTLSKEMKETCNEIIKLMAEFKKELDQKVDLLDIKLSK